ncbi:putative PurR-regulated permease PerM [Limnobacter thiooxidans]|uniref:AI-2E family transporter n=2 Tax=Limnobacter thiooxidans TaxID=131080 RepID=A0AA86MC30_9BURK|nr:putative PurR-regulated permease PerM [Limnobacter thiooxidans]BET27403.1 AI-2E family transporter [Limnobacter thiooxidans]
MKDFPVNSKNQTQQSRVSLSSLAKQFYLQHWGLLLSAALVLAVLIVLWPVLAPFVAAFVLAYLLAAPSRWVHRKLRGRLPLPVCAVLTFVGFLLIFSSVSLLFIPVVLTQLELIQGNLPQLIVNVKHTVLPRLNDVFGLNISVDSTEMKDRIAKYIGENRGTLAEVSTKILRSGSQSVLGITGFVSLTIVATLFILPSWTQICRQLQQVFPPHVWTRAQPVFNEIDTVMTEYIKGMMIVMLFLSTFYSIGLSVVGLQSGWAIGMLAGLLCVVPYLGFALALVVGLLTAALELQGFLPILLVLFVFVAGQFLEGFVLTPLVVGDKIGLSALAVIFALAFFGAIFGLVGVFLALPLAAIFKVAYVQAFAHYEQSRYYRQGE